MLNVDQPSFSPNLSSESHTTNAKPIAQSSTYIRAYFYVYILAIVLCWSPLKALAYLTPWIGLGVFFLLTGNQRVLSRVLLVLVIWLVMLLPHILLTPGFVLHSAILTLLTYSAFIFLFATPTKPLASHELLDRMLSVARWLLLFEAVWGIAQSIAAAISTGIFGPSNGDVVAGTIRPFSVYPDFSNQMFAANIALLLVCLIPSLVYRKKGFLPFLTGAFALFLASVVHVLLLLLLSLAVSFLLFYPGFRKKTGLFAVIVIFFLLFSLTPQNFQLLAHYLTQTISGNTPRAVVIGRIATDGLIHYPWLPWIGIGLGQFSSRAGLIGTGMYFGGPISPQPVPFLPQGMSDPFRDYVLDMWLYTASLPYAASSTVYPFFSWLSLLIELGLVGCLLVTLVIGELLRRVWIAGRRSASYRLQAATTAAGIVFVLLLGIQENYWEVPQAIFIGLLLLKVQYACLRYQN